MVTPLLPAASLVPAATSLTDVTVRLLYEKVAALQLAAAMAPTAALGPESPPPQAESEKARQAMPSELSRYMEAGAENGRVKGVGFVNMALQIVW